MIQSVFVREGQIVMKASWDFGAIIFPSCPTETHFGKLVGKDAPEVRKIFSFLNSFL